MPRQAQETAEVALPAAPSAPPQRRSRRCSSAQLVEGPPHLGAAGRRPAASLCSTMRQAARSKDVHGNAHIRAEDRGI